MSYTCGTRYRLLAEERNLEQRKRANDDWTTLDGEALFTGTVLLTPPEHRETARHAMSAPGKVGRGGMLGRASSADGTDYGQRPIAERGDR